MLVSDIRILLRKLNDCCTRAVEQAVGSSVNHGHYEVRCEHVVHALLEHRHSELCHIVQAHDVDRDALSHGLALELEQLRTGNTGKPIFSPQLLEVLEHAWSLGTLRFGLTNITSGVLFLAFLDKGMQWMGGYASLLKPLCSEGLKERFVRLVAGVQEGGVGIERHGEAGARSTEGVLGHYCVNLTAQARAGRIDAVLGRDEEIAQIMDILSRRRKNNPILVGDAGVGKTAVVEGLALRIACEDVPESLLHVDVWGLDMGQLEAGASVKGEFERRLKALIDAIQASAHKALLFVDEAHMLIGAGGAEGQHDAANLLKPALARGELRTIAATTWGEYRRYFERDAALARRFQLLAVKEPDEQRCMVMVRGAAARYGCYHGVHIADEAIQAATRLSHRYMCGRQLPDKAFDVLDTAAARVRRSQSAKPAALDNAERALATARLELAAMDNDLYRGGREHEERRARCNESIVKYLEHIELVSRRWEQEKTLAAQIATLQQELVAAPRELDSAQSQSRRLQLHAVYRELERVQGEHPLVHPVVSAAVCAQVVADWTGISVGAVLKDEAARLLDLEGLLGRRVIGQAGAVGQIADTIRMAQARLGNPEAPRGVLLFAGPSGVGKTECAHALAEALFGGEAFMTVIALSEYQEKHTVSQLKGAPPGYVGFGEGGVLTEAIRRAPYSLIVLDEIEKAHPEVLNLFYQVFDKGGMRDGEGREVDFRNTIIVMTSNLGADTIVKLWRAGTMPAHQMLAEAIRTELTAHLGTSLLARCTVVPFAPLSAQVVRGVVALKLDRIAQRMMQAHGLHLRYTGQLVDSIAHQCVTHDAGARAVDALIERVIVPQLSREVLMRVGNDELGGRVELSLDEQGDVVDFCSPSARSVQGDKVADERYPEVGRCRVGVLAEQGSGVLE